MSAYATVADVQAEFKGGVVFNTTSAVKDTQVQSFIDQATALINGKVGMRYVLPITATDALTLLKGICIWIVVQRLKPLLRIDAGGGKGSQSPSDDDLIKRAEKALLDIQNNTTDLTILGAVLRSTGDGADSGNVRDGVSPTFKRGTDQW